MKILKKLWDMLPEGRPIWVPGPAEWGIEQEEEKKSIRKIDEIFWRTYGIYDKGNNW